MTEIYQREISVTICILISCEQIYAPRVHELLCVTTLGVKHVSNIKNAYFKYLMHQFVSII